MDSKETFGKYEASPIGRNDYGLELFEIEHRSSHKSDRIVVTSSGKSLLRQHPQILDLLFAKKPGKEHLVWDSWLKQWMLAGLRSRIYRTRQKEGIIRRGPDLAIKEPLPTPEGRDSTAIEQINALTALRSNGLLTISPIIASESTNRLVTYWHNGKHPNGDTQERLEAFVGHVNHLLESMATNGQWDTSWGTGIDRQPRNYFVESHNQTDVARWFRMIDPISRRTIIIW